MKNLKPNVYAKICPSREVLALIGEKWCSLIVGALAKNQVLRFGELKKICEGISQKMLTQTLRNMERSGLVTRKVYVVQLPLKVEYQLTEIGESLVPIVNTAKRWAEEHLHSIEKKRKEYDRRESSDD
jgi:DNA-binding HxlR family transcriptional regulator